MSTRAPFPWIGEGTCGTLRVILASDGGHGALRLCPSYGISLRHPHAVACDDAQGWLQRLLQLRLQFVNTRVGRARRADGVLMDGLRQGMPRFRRSCHFGL